jgi:hypothetical protein
MSVDSASAPSGENVLLMARQYNDAFALMHENVYDDSVPLTLTQIDASVLDVRLLSPLDLAVSKISRFSSQDRDDITMLAQQGLIRAAALRRRAQQAVANYVGNLDTLKGSMELAVRIVEDAEKRHSS